jgi:hypothetical protein
MAKQTLFAYAQGTDFEPHVAAIEAKLDALVSSRAWLAKDVWVVNQRFPPDWDLGLNVTLPTKKTKQPAWMDDVVAIAGVLAAIHTETGTRFVIGIHDAQSDTTKDLFVVDTNEPDTKALEAAIAAAA